MTNLLQVDLHCHFMQFKYSGNYEFFMDVEIKGKTVDPSLFTKIIGRKQMRHFWRRDVIGTVAQR